MYYDEQNNLQFIQSLKSVMKYLNWEKIILSQWAKMTAMKASVTVAVPDLKDCYQ